MRKTLTAFVLLALAACSSGEEAPEDGSQVELTVSTTDGPLYPDEATTQPDPGEGAIPARFLGVWDYEGGTCARDSDLRVQIRPESMSFYESIGTVTAVAAEGDDTLVTLAMEGEGEMWTQVTRLALKGEGEALRLHTSDGEKPPVPDEYPSKRCPEEPSE
ncbi:MAG: hypothetical protein AAFR88_11740 [Pseudomonadota bacterium]